MTGKDDADATEEAKKVLERAEDLRRDGWIHITGLPLVDYFRDATEVAGPIFEAKALSRFRIPTGDVDPNQPIVIGKHRRTVQTFRLDLGFFGANHGKAVLVTEDGEVWLSVVSVLKKDAHKKYAKPGHAYVFCSNTEQIPLHLIMMRVENPYCDCNGHHSPVPDIQGFDALD
jgi:hypothetical protein